MKPATLLALPVLALAAATPAKVEERQLGGLDPTRLIDLDCLEGLTGIAQCLTIDPTNPPLNLGDVLGLVNRLTCPIFTILAIPSCLVPL